MEYYHIFYRVADQWYYYNIKLSLVTAEDAAAYFIACKGVNATRIIATEGSERPPTPTD